MLWQYIIVFGAIIISFAYLIRYFIKKFKTPSSNCANCPLASKAEQYAADNNGKLPSCSDCFVKLEN